MPSSPSIARLLTGFIVMMITGCSHLETLRSIPMYDGRVAVKLTTSEKIVSSMAQVQVNSRSGIRFLLEDPMGTNTGEIFISPRDIDVDLYADDCVYRLENWSSKLALMSGESVDLEQLFEWIMPLDKHSSILTLRMRHSRRVAVDVSCVPPSEHHFGIVRFTGFHPRFTLQLKWISEPAVTDSLAIEVPKREDRSVCDADDFFRELMAR